MKSMGLLVASALLAACGTNQFEQELALEQAAVPLARQTVAGGYALVTAGELAQWLDAKKDVLLVDCMPYAESFAKEHLPGARNFLFPKEEMSAWDPSQTGGKSEADFEAFLGPDRGRTVVFYCGYVKCPRSHNGALWAARRGYSSVVRFAGGIDAWKGAGRPLEKD